MIRCKLKQDCKRLLWLGKVKENWNKQYFLSPLLAFLFLPFLGVLPNSLGWPATVIKSVIQSASRVETDPAPDGISTNSLLT